MILSSKNTPALNLDQASTSVFTVSPHLLTLIHHWLTGLFVTQRCYNVEKHHCFSSIRKESTLFCCCHIKQKTPAQMKRNVVFVALAKPQSLHPPPLPFLHLQDMKQLSSVPLTGCSVEELQGQPCFCLGQSKTTHTFSCDSPQLKQRWLTVLKVAVTGRMPASHTLTDSDVIIIGSRCGINGNVSD